MTAVRDRGTREARGEEPRPVPEVGAADELYEERGARDPRRGVRVGESGLEGEDDVRVVRAEQTRRPRRLHPAEEAVERRHRPEPELLAGLQGRVGGGPGAR